MHSNSPVEQVPRGVLSDEDAVAQMQAKAESIGTGL